MNHVNGNFIIMLIQTVVFLIPVLVLFYRVGRRDQILDEAVRDVNGLGKKVADIRDDQGKALAELKSQIEDVGKTLIKVTITMDYIKKDIEELKRKRAKENDFDGD
jgi:septal ring factor EnvC (AmiA/AmiB activator)